MVSFTLNNRKVSVDADPSTPLLWAIRDHVGLTRHEIRLWCRSLRCLHHPHRWQGAALVARSTWLGCRKTSSPSKACHLALRIRCRRRGDRRSPTMRLLPVGADHEAAELLAKNPKPSRAEIITHMDGNICRCGTYHRHHRRHRARSAGGLSHDHHRSGYLTSPA